MTKQYLTLVDRHTKTSYTSVPRRLSTDINGQFRLHFEDVEKKHIVIFVMDEVHGLHLVSAVGQYHPKMVFDLRHTLRFDQPGLSRNSFFKYLDQINSTYLRLIMEWSEVTTKHLATECLLPPPLYKEAIRKVVGAIAVLVSKREHAKSLETMLNIALTEHSIDSWNIEKIT